MCICTLTFRSQDHINYQTKEIVTLLSGEVLLPRLSDTESRYNESRFITENEP